MIYVYDRTLTVLDELDLVWQRRKISVATGLYLLLHISFSAHLCLQIALIATAQTSSGCTVRPPCLSLAPTLTSLFRRGMAESPVLLLTGTRVLTALTALRSHYTLTLLDFCVSLLWSASGDGEHGQAC